MPITTNDLQWRLSNPDATAGDATAQAEPASSLGSYLSTTIWSGGTPGDLFQDLSPARVSQGTALYRCVFILNTHTTKTLLAAAAYLPTQVAGGGTLALGIDPTAASAKTSSTPQAVSVAAETSSPAGVTFSAPTTAATGLNLGDLPPGSCRAIWLRLTGGGNTATPQTGDGGEIAVRGQTYA